MIKINSKKILRVSIVIMGVLLVLIALTIVSSRVASHNKNENSIYNIEYTVNSNNITVFDGLESYSKNKNIELKYNHKYSFGVFIESIANIKNGEDGKYWQYYVNDKLGDVAADKKELKAGDIVEWRFEKVSEI